MRTTFQTAGGVTRAAGASLSAVHELGRLAAGGTAHQRLTKFAPVLLIQLYFVFLRGGFDAFPGGVAFRVGHPLHLLEAGDCVAHVGRVMDGFFTFLGESEVFTGEAIAASFSDLGHACKLAIQWPICPRHRRNPATPPVDSSKAASSIIVTVAPACLAYEWLFGDAILWSQHILDVWPPEAATLAAHFLWPAWGARHQPPPSLRLFQRQHHFVVGKCVRKEVSGK